MLSVMICQKISIQEIDSTNELFRISEEIVSAPLQASIREIGQLNPVLLTEEGENPYTIVCGFRRLHALRQLNGSHVFARIIKKGDRDLPGIFSLALWDNLSHRGLEPLEKARVLYKLRHDFGVPDDAIIRKYQPRMNLAAHEQVLRTHLMLHTSHPGLRQYFKEGRLSLSSLEYLAATSSASQESIASAFEEMRMSAGLQKRFFGLLEDLAAKNGVEPGIPFRDPEVLAVLKDTGSSPFQRGEKVYEVLYRRRYPKVTEAEQRFLERKNSLGLPGSIRITPAPYFETPDLRVEFNAPDAERFRGIVAELFEVSQKPELDKLFKFF